jgi:ABC-type uncharacterized transport system permease subunit
MSASRAFLTISTDLFGLAFAIMILGFINGQWLAPFLRATVLRIKATVVGTPTKRKNN